MVHEETNRIIQEQDRQLKKQLLAEVRDIKPPTEPNTLPLGWDNDEFKYDPEETYEINLMSLGGHRILQRQLKRNKERFGSR